MWSSQAVIEMFHLVSAEHINQGSLGLYIYPQRNPKQGRKAVF